MNLSKKRLLAIFIDYIFCLAVFLSIEIGIGASLDDSIRIYIPIIPTFLLLIKDVFHGKSIGKRLYKIGVTYEQTATYPTPYVSVIRNFTLIIWPIELLLLFRFNKRIGDMFFKTCVIEDNQISSKKTLTLMSVMGSFLLALLMSIIVFFVLNFLNAFGANFMLSE